MSDQQVAMKKIYTKFLVIHDELLAYSASIQMQENSAEAILAYFRAFRGLLITLTSCHDSMQYAETELHGLGFKSDTTKEFRKSLDFVRHMRNVCAGHLNDVVVEKGIQWQPSLFHIECKGNIIPSYIFANIAIMEVAINSYIDTNGNHKLFKSTIDFLYPPDFTQITSFMLVVCQQAMDYLAARLDFLENTIVYHTDHDMLEMNYIAAKTNFSLSSSPDYGFSESAALETFKEGMKALHEFVNDPAKSKEYERILTTSMRL